VLLVLVLPELVPEQAQAPLLEPLAAEAGTGIGGMQSWTPQWATGIVVLPHM